MRASRPFRALVDLLLLLAVAGCEGAGGSTEREASRPALPGFSADTFSREGLISGASATEAGCRALPDGIWVDIGSRQECIRFVVGGAGQPARTALVHFPGDPPEAAYSYVNGEARLDWVGEFYEHTPASRRLAAEALAGAMHDGPVFLIGRAGMHGSSGNHAQDRQTRDEMALMDGALTALKRRYGFQDFALSGFSSGGLIVANLLARREDIRCAVIASAPLDLSLYYRQPDGTIPNYFAVHRGNLEDPMQTVGAVRSRATVFVIGDTRDRSVPHTSWANWVAAARHHGIRVYNAETKGGDLPVHGPVRTYHLTGSRGLEAAHACASGKPPEQIRRALLAGQPILIPHGRRLSGDEIKAAFSGRQLSGIMWPQWGTRVTVSVLWTADGKRVQFHPAHPEHVMAADRWWVEGDRLCTSEDACNAVLTDGRFLHVVTGQPPRFLMTFDAGHSGDQGGEQPGGAAGAAPAAPPGAS